MLISSLPVTVIATGLFSLATVGYSLWILFSHRGECSKTFAVLAGLGSTVMLLLLALRLSSDDFVPSQFIGQAQLSESYGQLRQLYDLFSSVLCLIVLHVLKCGHHQEDK